MDENVLLSCFGTGLPQKNSTHTYTHTSFLFHKHFVPELCVLLDVFPIHSSMMLYSDDALLVAGPNFSLSTFDGFYVLQTV